MADSGRIYSELKGDENEMNKRICVITGGGSGMGLETAMIMGKLTISLSAAEQQKNYSML